MTRVCHMTSAHSQEDDRIFLKECLSLADAGYEVYEVAKGNSYDKDGVHIIGVGAIPENRIKRMLQGAKSVYTKALELNCDIYHFHDPELLPYGLKLKKKGKKVIFDSHEDVPGQIMDKEWIPKPFRKIISGLYRSYETYAVSELDAVVAATPHIAEKFEGRAQKVVIINNYPKLDDIVYHTTPFSKREPIVCYAGGINELRGEKIMIEAMRDVDGVLIIAGDHEKMELGGGIVRYLGRLDRTAINALYRQSVLGLCILKPIENYYYSQPIKIYEYMAAGLPFICSDFPGWKQIVEESKAGICVNPNDTKLIREKIKELLLNRDRAQQMGRNGHDYVIAHCTWSVEENKLCLLYKDI